MKIFSHFTAFIVGVFAGILINYYSAKLTDRRRNNESIKEQKEKFLSVKAQMTELISDMKENLLKPGLRMHRTFYILSSTEVTLNIKGPAIIYYESKNTSLTEKISVLENNGYITDITVGKTPKYKMSEEFVILLLKY